MQNRCSSVPTYGQSALGERELCSPENMHLTLTLITANIFVKNLALHVLKQGVEESFEVLLKVGTEIVLQNTRAVYGQAHANVTHCM